MVSYYRWSPAVQRGHLEPGHVLGSDVVQAADVIEGANQMVRFQGAQEAKVILVLQAVIEGGRYHQGECDRLGLRLF